MACKLVKVACLLFLGVALASAAYRSQQAWGSMHRATTATMSYARRAHATQRAMPGHTIIDDCTCFEKGNYYSPVVQNNCGSFTQSTQGLPAETHIVKCPYGLMFDVKTCVCSRSYDTAARCTKCQQSLHQSATQQRQRGNMRYSY